MAAHAASHPSSPYKQTISFLAPLLSYRHDPGSVKSSTLVDLGGGNGHVSIQIAHAFPDLQFLIQDLSSNRNAAEHNISAQNKNESKRIKFEEQDFFKPQPQNLWPRAYYMRATLHDWSDEDSVRILQNLVPKMMPIVSGDGRREEGARLYIMDRILPDRSSATPALATTIPVPPDPLAPNPSAPGAQGSATSVISSRHTEGLQRYLDLLMYALFRAKERSLSQWRNLFHAVNPRLQVLRWELPVGCELGMLEVGYVP